MLSPEAAISADGYEVRLFDAMSTEEFTLTDINIWLNY